MIEYILLIIILYFLIGIFVMDRFLSNKYIYEGTCLHFKLKFGRDLNKRDYFWIVVVSSYMWPKIVFFDIVYFLHKVDKDQIVKENLENFKKNMEVKERCKEFDKIDKKRKESIDTNKKGEELHS